MMQGHGNENAEFFQSYWKDSMLQYQYHNIQTSAQALEKRVIVIVLVCKEVA